MTSSSPTTDEMDTGTTIHVVPDGDVVLIVGPAGRRLGQLSKTGSTEIALPEDDADAMETLFSVMHCRNDRVKKVLEPDKLLRVAIACDKYDCFVSLEFATHTWLSHRGATKSEDLWAVAMAACLFREQQAFADATSALVYSHAGSFVDLTREHEGMMDSTLVMLEEARNKVRMSLLRDVLTGDWRCGGKGKDHRPRLLMTLARIPSALDGMSVSDAMDTVGQDTPSGHPAEYPADDYSIPAAVHGYDSEKQDPASAIIDKFRRQRGNAAGLCLQCVWTKEEHGSHL
ncbi:hypothetical protein GE09DRAFT_1231918 [Coniochaeta sp. 2T2.1]|nr:hypothetical protein GE09DRAFT_1231918 [Coniochaeta sp. 2T2.1]